MTSTYYFGPIGEAGHFWWSSDTQRASYDGPPGHPWGFSVDGRLAPRVPPLPRNEVGAYDHQSREYHRSVEAPQGRAALLWVQGWTAVSFWDRSVDKRGASNSAFVIHESNLSFDLVMMRARADFPKRCAVMGFEVVMHELFDGSTRNT